MRRIVFTARERSPSRDLGTAITRMSAKNLPSQIPSQGTARNHVGCEVLLTDHACRAHRRGGAVGQNLRKGTWILVRYDARDCPTHRRVFRYKRCSALKELAFPVSGQRPFA